MIYTDIAVSSLNNNMSSYVAICSAVPEKIFEGFLLYMGMAAILVM